MTPASRPQRVLIATGLVMWCVAGVLGGCSTVEDRQQPAWIGGASPKFPPSQYLVGLGEADSRPAATERAYEAVARVFRAEISAQARDWESYVLLERPGGTNEERHLTIDRVTRVSTNKVLENVQVLDAWFDPASRIHYVLAGMDRAQGEVALLERIAHLDDVVQTALDSSRDRSDTLAVIQNLKRAAATLVLREAYNADLRIIRRTGQGHPTRYRVPDLTAELETFLSEHLIVGVEVAGDHADTIRRAVMEGLVRQGLPVTDRRLSEDSADGTSSHPGQLFLLVTGSARLWKAEIPDPLFTYVRWCADFVIKDLVTDRIVGAVSRRGREGHVTDQEARTRALRAMQRELTAELGTSLAGYVYGEREPVTDLTAPAACAQDPPQQSAAAYINLNI